ncbi:MAG: Cell division protein FtsL [Actinobacteria bacterium ADurb.Bin346]|nr:MAG: Cell division protein FtsL [Actinobacteria bacterium ADurb.Bin346]
MNTRLAEEEIFNRKTYPLLYLVKRQEKTGKEKIIHTRSGAFYIMMIVVIFFAMGILINIGLKIQNLNYERKIIEANELISLENERTDRIKLKISELTSPSRIIRTAEENLDMQLSDKIKIMKVSGSKLGAVEKVQDFMTENTPSSTENYDNFLGTIYSVKDIIMVVSEGVLTFFIP